jgi:hypothetical protein
MTEGKLRRIHWLIGGVALLLFVLTGAYMRWVHDPPVEELDATTRAVYRSRHIFILLTAIANLARAAGVSLDKFPAGLATLAASAILAVAPLVLTAAFFIEPPLGVDGRSVSTPMLYSMFLAALILLFHRPSDKH